MGFRKAIALVGVASMVLPGLALAQVPSITVTSPASCVAQAGSHLVTANIPGDIAMARVLFRAEETTCGANEYYVDMRRGEGGSFWAVLPPTATGTNRISYRVWARTPDGSERVTELRTIKVDAACTAPALTADQQAFAQNMAVGVTRDDQVVVPCGFGCNGIARVITASGRMYSVDACAASAVAAAALAGGAAGATAAGAAGVAGIAGMSAGGGILLGLGLVAGAVAIDNAQDDDNTPDQISPARP